MRAIGGWTCRRTAGLTVTWQQGGDVVPIICDIQEPGDLVRVRMRFRWSSQILDIVAHTDHEPAHATIPVLS